MQFRALPGFRDVFPDDFARRRRIVDERQQRGRLREHLQLNMDIIGEPGALADAEIIAAAIDIMRLLGFGPKDVRVRLSDRRVLAEALSQSLGVLESELPGVLAAFDRY